MTKETRLKLAKHYVKIGRLDHKCVKEFEKEFKVKAAKNNNNENTGDDNGSA